MCLVSLCSVSYDLLLAFALPLYLISTLLLKLTSRDSASNGFDYNTGNRANDIVSASQITVEPGVCYQQLTVMMLINYVVILSAMIWVSR